jgi:succinate-semialdehyde dehydrogenase/glutarate-semialdehyde dehydrogenase
MNKVLNLPTLHDMSLFRQNAFIGGHWTEADSGAVIEVTDPANGDWLGTIPDMAAAEAARAVDDA